MANVIAIIWDFDNTLINGNMQDPIFKHYDVDAKSFWDEVDMLPALYFKQQGVKVNPDTIYLNHFIHKIHDGTFAGLNNERLRDFGCAQNFFPGVPDIFLETKKIGDCNHFREFNIIVEHYIVSSGMKEIITGSPIAQYVDGIWGCEFIEHEINGVRELGEIAYTIDNTTKTRALFEINKGIPKHPEINVNAKMDRTLRRVDFSNMIYIADGPSDIPAFSVIKKQGGKTFAVYKAKDKASFIQAEKLRSTGRVDMYGEADYSKDTLSYLWITTQINELAERIIAREKSKLSGLSDTPKHIN